MSKPPTLADELMVEMHRKGYRGEGVNVDWTINHLAKARKFYLDDRMSGFLGDLGNAVLLKHPDRGPALMESMRILVRLPYPVTWIEYNTLERFKRSRELGVNQEIDNVPANQREGWLCVQHPSVDTAVMAVPCSNYCYPFEEGMIDPKAQPMSNVDAFAYVWRTDDQGPIPWPALRPLEIYTNRGKEEQISVGGALTGVVQYITKQVSVSASPMWKHLVVEKQRRSDMQKMIELFVSERAGDLRYLWAFLATLNDLPVEVTEVRPTKGYLARGNYKKFMAHSVISINMPVHRMARIAAQAIAIARRRAHEVRGHWRDDWRHRPDRTCLHDFHHRLIKSNMPDVQDKEFLECSHCHGRKSWVHPHQRGDASLGYVTHDYEITHESK